MQRIDGRAPTALVVLFAAVLSAFPAKADPPGDGKAERIQVAQQPRNNLQIRINRFGQQGVSDNSVVFFPSDRTTNQRLAQAKKLLEEDRYSESVRLLNEVLEGDEDYFPPQQDVEHYRSLKAEALRLLGEMPRAGKEAYELQYGQAARRLLDEAIREGRIESLEEVSRRYFHTKAGAEATYLLGIRQMDAGEYMGAALLFMRLIADDEVSRAFEPGLTLRAAAAWRLAGANDQAQAMLMRLKTNYPDARIEIGGQQHRLFDTAGSALAWLGNLIGESRETVVGDQWAMAGGSPSRNAISNGGDPLLSRRWAVQVTPSSNIEEALAKRRQALTDAKRTMLPAAQPLAVGDFVFTRTVAGLVGIDFHTGKRIWRGPIEPPLQDVVDAINQPHPQRRAPMLDWLEKRVWSDACYGGLSSDGQCVFSVEDLAALDQEIPTRLEVRPDGRRTFATGERDFNRLAAYEIATEGKLRWVLGGPPGDTELPLAGTFFLGPPLPVGGVLYTLAEIKGEIRLFALDAATGDVKWSQQLAVLERPIQLDERRRLAGVTPSYSDGVLVCPTAGGAVVAVDAVSRSLLWGYKYPGRDEERRRSVAIFRGWTTHVAQLDEDRWTDSTVVISGGRALVTPPDSDTLHCLDLFTGEPLWKAPRGDCLYIAMADREKVLVVGRARLRTYDMKDGRPRSNAFKFPDGATPTGRGYYADGVYYLPLSNATVVAIDANTGEQIAQARSRSGRAPGNLICHNGAVISQSYDAVECFYLLDDLRREIAEKLEKQPNDPSALARRGEVLLHDGQLSEAIASLRTSYEMDANPRTRAIFLDALMEGLQTDFAAYRDHAPEVERLLESPAQRAAFLRTTAEGLDSIGDSLAAFNTYLQLADLESDAELDQLDTNWLSRRDRWIPARLAALRSSAGADAAASMDRIVEDRLTEALASKSPDKIESFIEHFDSFAAASGARETLLKQFGDALSPLEHQRLLLRLEKSEDAATARLAAARNVQILRDTARQDEALPYFERFASEWADEVVADGKTGRALVASLPENSLTAKRLRRVDLWPRGEVEKSSQRPSSQSRTVYPVEIIGLKGPFFQDTTLEFDASRTTLVGRNGFGQELWKISAADSTGMNYGTGFPAAHARVYGHLAVISVNNQIIGIDTLGVPGKEPGRVLWKYDLSEPFGTNVRYTQMSSRQMETPWGTTRIVALDPEGRPIGTLGPVTSRYACFQRGRSLIAVDPYSGSELWTRDDIPPGADFFGDEELLFVVPYNGSTAIVLRASDGMELDSRDVRTAGQRLATIGRDVLFWSRERTKPTLSRVDVWTNTVKWTHSFEPDAQPWPLDDETVAVLERSGRFREFNTSDGETVLDTKVEPVDKLEHIHMFRSRGEDILIARRPISSINGISPHMVAGASLLPIDGVAYGFDRASGELLFKKRINDLWLVPNQASELPFICFMRYSAANSQRATRRSEYVCYDKRTGREILQQPVDGLIDRIDFSADPEKHEASIHARGSTVTLKFTSKPIADSDDLSLKRGESLIEATLRLWREVRQGGLGDESVRGSAEARDRDAKRANVEKAEQVEEAVDEDDGSD